MKKLPLTLALSIGLLSSNSFAADKNLQTLEQKASYTLAVDLAKNFEKQGLNIDLQAFSLGLEDAMKNQPLRLSNEEMNQAVNDVKQQMIQKKMAEREAQGKVNAEAGKKFLAENAKKEGIKTLDSGIQYRVIASGKGESPKADDVVFAHYEGRLLDGTVFDSSYQRGQALKFSLDGVIKGWSEIIQQMKPGDKWEVFIPSDMAYGDKGAGEVIGPNQTLIFDIELISFNPSKD